MSIDLLPFRAFALESCAAPARSPGEGQTLTVALRTARNPASIVMSGRLAVRALEVAAPDASRFAIARVDSTPVTITF